MIMEGKETKKTKIKAKWGLRAWIILLAVVLILVFAALLSYWKITQQPKNAVAVSLSWPVTLFVEGPITGIEFLAEKKIKPSLITVSVKNSEGKIIAGRFVDNKKAKAFRWKATDPIKAGKYTVTVGGKNILKKDFSFSVYEVEKTEDVNNKTSEVASQEGNKELYEKLLKKLE